MEEYTAFIFTSKLELKAYFRFECCNIKIPLFHLVVIGDGVPYFFHRGIVNPLNFKRFIFHFFQFYSKKIFTNSFLLGFYLRVFFILLPFTFSSCKKLPRASNFFVQKTLYCSIHRETSFSFFSFASQILSLP